jgi:hypothetical protein
VTPSCSASSVIDFPRSPDLPTRIVLPIPASRRRVRHGDASARERQGPSRRARNLGTLEPFVLRAVVVAPVMIGTSLLGIVGAVIATLLGLAVLLAVVTVVLLHSGTLNGVVEEVVAARANRPAQLEQAPSLGYENGAVILRLGPISVANTPWRRTSTPTSPAFRSCRRDFVCCRCCAAGSSCQEW